LDDNVSTSSEGNINSYYTRMDGSCLSMLTRKSVSLFLLEAVGEKLLLEIDERQGSNMVPESYELIIECKDEADQKEKFDRFTAMGLKVRILNL